ncbi:uncharacterized protein Z519_10436 [Cladophialophora bantiana CBS 173.52]|uniref:BTB domain-containing protein n=1 Tax=Cladophialophora bantiana (strain ATCC 10958 / CBS 173.52 / CDC B-1940 / NIH 8579) TaxID=1442370 RepID=A0A0D2FQW3_CLAB1|nr:uncharacterized protein Z519_10436 [Cladophialophora bantiana CBS 173.52]KIW88952.1 hypothetical protein Z519_10436 [Cladophialophora bantiana CBS 173.52]
MFGSLFSRNLKVEEHNMMNQATPAQSQSPAVEAQAAGVQKGKSKVKLTAGDGARRDGAEVENENARDSDGSGDPEGEEEDEEEEEEDEDEEEDDDDDDVDNFTTSEIVTVHVGPKRKRFHLHRDLICQRSPFMEKCLQKNRFDEGYKNELYLPEDDPKAFSIVVEWIYRGRLPVFGTFGTSAIGSGSTAGARGTTGLDMCDMSQAYCMADKFGMEELQNGIMDCIRTNYRLGSGSGSGSGNGHNHSHIHHIIGGGHGSNRDASRPSLVSSLSAPGADRDAQTGSDSTASANLRPNYSALALVHLHGPHKSPLKRFFIEHLVHHMMTFPRYYHDHLRKSVADDTDRAEFEELFKIPELAMLIMRKVWQWQIEKFGDPARDKGCAYHVHSTTQCDSKLKAASSMAGKGSAGNRPIGSGLGGSPSTHPAVLLQSLARNQQNQSSWMGSPSTSLGGWHPGVGW